MTASLSRETRLESRRRRRRLVLVLLVVATALTWVFPATSAGLSQFSSNGSPLPSAFAGRPVPGSPTVSAPIATESVVPGAFGTGDGDGLSRTGSVNFGISGSGAENLRLGVTTVIRLTLTNPNAVPIYVTSLKVTVSDGGPAGCGSRDNIRITQSSVSNAGPIAVPARTAVTLASAPTAPQITLLNLADVNQDACKSKVFNLTYSGSARS